MPKPKVGSTVTVKSTSLDKQGKPMLDRGQVTFASASKFVMQMEDGTKRLRHTKNIVK